MTISEINKIGLVIRANRFHIKSDGVKALADHFTAAVPEFNRAHWFNLIDGRGCYQPKTGAACGCRPGVERDNCSRCEGTGQVIDFAAIRALRAQS